MSSEPVLRRSSRNAAKREAPPLPAVENRVPPLKKKRSRIITSPKPSTPESEAALISVTPLKTGDALPEDLPEIQTHTGETIRLHDLVRAASKGIIIFAYPRASTPGCTKQASAFRDHTAVFKDAGFTVFGLSGDSPAANERFKTKLNLTDITLLCDPGFELHARLGIKKAPKGTIRSVIVIGKTEDGATILQSSPASPANSIQLAEAATGVLPKEQSAKDE